MSAPVCAAQRGGNRPLLGFLDYLREGVAAKVEGAPEPQVRAAGVESGTNLLGLVKHLTAVERFTFLGVSVRSWPATFRPNPSESVEDIVTAYRDTVSEVNEVLAEITDLAAPVNRPTARGRPPPARWALTHVRTF